MSKIDLCTINYNTKDLLIRQLQHLQKGYTDEHKELFNLRILDNASSDGSQEYLIEFDPPSFVTNYILQHQNQGYSFGCNLLGSAGDGEIIGLLNADVWLTADDVKKIAESFDNHPEMDIMGPKQRDEKGFVRAGPIVWTKREQLKHLGWNNLDKDDLSLRERVRCATVSGSAYFVRRSVWDDLTSCEKYVEFEKNETGKEPVGPLLSTPHFFEETFVSMHANHHRYQVWYDGNISIGHSWRASTGPSPILTEHFKTSSQIYKRACDHEGIRREKV